MSANTLIIPIIILILIINIVFANEFRSVARDKGYDSIKYFWYVFIFGIIGMLLVIALPNKNK